MLCILILILVSWIRFDSIRQSIMGANKSYIYYLASVVDPDPHHFDNLDPDPLQVIKLDPHPDEHQIRIRIEDFKKITC